jgi:hypothetical protein
MDEKKAGLSGLGYVAFHSFMHLALAGLVYFLSVRGLSFDSMNLIAVILGSAALDLDHIPLMLRTGIGGYLKLRSEDEIGKARKYALHNLTVVLILVAGSLISLVGELRPLHALGLFFAAAAMHGLWDFFEDVTVFKLGYRHWI